MSAELARRMRAAADAGDRAVFDDLARELGGRWIDWLCSQADPERLEALADRFANLDDYNGRVAWITAAGTDAGYVVARWCLHVIAALDRYAGGTPYAGYRIVDAFGAYLSVEKERVEAPWFWVELVATVPHHKRALGEHLGYAGKGLLSGRIAVPLAHVLRGPRVSFRGLLGHFLEQERAIGIELAIEWLADPALRPTAELVLGSQIADAAPALRDLIERSSAGTRDAAVRLLRKQYPRIALDGRVADDDDATLQTRLRTDPDDAAASAVWADLLGSRGDPRGEHIALEHAIRAATDPARALELSNAQAALVDRERKKIWGRPGGFPFRERYRGRNQIVFQSDWNHRMRRTAQERLFDRLQSFANHITDAHGPIELHVGRHLDGASGDSARRDPADDRLARDLVDSVGEATVFADDDHYFLRRPTAAVPVVAPDRLRHLVNAHPDMTVIYEFVLTSPGTRIALPHQEAAHYAGTEPIVNRLALHVATRDLRIDLAFPFESFGDPRFLAVYDAIHAVLGRILPAGGFMVATASADGKRLVTRKERFER